MTGRSTGGCCRHHVELCLPQITRFFCGWFFNRKLRGLVFRLFVAFCGFFLIANYADYANWNFFIVSGGVLSLHLAGGRIPR